ncbi:MAG: cysteine desulfurase NifS [Pseudomonadota bacterium]
MDIYLDHNATTQIDNEVLEEMIPFLKNEFGNPSSIHKHGRSVRIKLEEARYRVADIIDASPSEIFFTSGGSESDNLAIKGAFYNLKSKGNHIITTKVEHPAVLETCQYLEKNNGANITYLSVDHEGMLNLEELKNAITDKTILISIMAANNELGTIYPLKEISVIAREKNILFHSDAVQAIGKIPISVKDVRLDLLSLSGHKIYGPKGIGALYIRKGIKLERLIHGGHQEMGRRSGTENTAGIVALGKACEIAKRDLSKNSERIKKLRDKLENGLIASIDDILINGHKENRVQNTLNVSFKYIEGEAILLHLDMHNIAASSGSACSSGSLDPSHVLLALGLSHEDAHGSIRFSLGRSTSEAQIEAVLNVMPKIVATLRSMSPITKS